MILAFCVATIFVSWLTALFVIGEYRSRKHFELFVIAEDRYLCKAIAEALEIEGDGESPASVVREALLERAKL